jgi:hypothetical protein
MFLVLKVEYFNAFIRDNVDEEDLEAKGPEEWRKVRKEVIQLVRDVFKMEDVNQDGYISHAEFVRKLNLDLASLQDEQEQQRANIVVPSRNRTDDKDEL